MRLTVEALGLTLDLTLGPTEYTDDDAPGTLTADLTHQGGAAIGFHTDNGGEPTYEDD